MIGLVLIGVFVLTVWTGPACQGARDARRAQRDYPMGKVIYLPSAVCTGRAPEVLAAIRERHVCTCALCSR